MLGWSDGGITALCAAILHPKAIEKVADIEMNITFDIYDNIKRHLTKVMIYLLDKGGGVGQQCLYCAGGY